MIAPMIKIYLFSVVLISIISSPVKAQICINKFTSVKYKGSTYDTFTASVATLTNEIISAGGLYDYNNAAHIAKYSANGSSIWSYQYNLNFFDFIKSIFFKTVSISDMINTSDGGLILAGYVEQLLSPFGNPPPVKKWGLLAKLDKFGKVMWTKTVTKRGEMSCTNLCTTADGDIIAYLATDNGPKKAPGDHSYNSIIRVGQDGKIKWSTFLFTYLFDAGGLGVSNKKGILQASNGNIIIGDVAHKTIANTGEIKEGNLHFFELNYNTGKINWERSYEYGALSNTYVPDIINIKELANGKFSFITTLYLTSTNGFIKKGANIITSKRGAIENIIAFTAADESPCDITAAAIDKTSGNRVLLLNNNGKKVLMNIDDSGRIVWQQGYDDEQGAFPLNCFSAGKNGYNIFCSNNKSKQFRLLITDISGINDCVNTMPNIITVPATLNLTSDSMVTDLSFPFDEYYDYGYPLKRGEEYPMMKNTDCLETIACCTDIIDSSAANTIAICEGKSYMLADSTVVKEAGTYPITFKTALGCDSIVFYKISIDKDVAKLTLGDDTCLTGQQVITLRATEGFEKYFWMNNAASKQPNFLITQPGKYSVNVENVCGSKTDSIEIFNQCDYKVFMPNAFTPNGDGLNDYFRISPSNKNKLINFSIYNRSGKLIFQTNNRSAAWDGTYKNEPQSADTFLYYLQMIGLSGNRISQQGTFVLIR